MKIKIFNKAAQSLLEVLLALALFSILTLAAATSIIRSIETQSRVEDEFDGELYLTECQEAVRSIRDDNFTNLENGTFGLSSANGFYELGPTPEIINAQYQRQIVITDVFRDDNFNIAESGTLDLESKKITCQVTWTRPRLASKTLQSTFYLTNWQNSTIEDSLIAEFNQGTLFGTEVINTPEPPVDNGSVTLEVVEVPAGFVSSVNLNNKKGNDVIVIGNRALVAVDDTDDGLQIVNVANIVNPLVVGEMDIGGQGLVIELNGDYAYMGTNNHNGGLVTLDVSNPNNPQITNTLDVDGTVNDIKIKGQYAYLARHNFSNGLVVVDLSNPAQPQYVTSELTIGEGQALDIKENTLYLGTHFNILGLNTIDITNPLDPEIIGVSYVYGAVNGVHVHNDALYLGVHNNSKGFIVMDITDPENPQYLQSVDIGGRGNKITTDGNYAYETTQIQNAGFVALDITNELNPVLAFNEDIQGQGNGLVVSGPFIFIGTTTNDRGLVILGIPIEGFAENGTFTSRIFDTGSLTTTYYTIQSDLLPSPGGDIYGHLRTADTQGNIATATFVGPDGTVNTEYRNPIEEITLDPNRSGQRYFQYRVTFEGDGVSSPVLNGITVNYRP